MSKFFIYVSLVLLFSFIDLQCLPIDTFINLREMVIPSLNQTNLFIIKQFENVRDNYDPRAYYDFTPKCCERHPWNVYAAPTATIGTVHSHEHLTGYDYKTGGVIAGIDYAFLNGGVGFQADYNFFSADPFKAFNPFNIEQLHGSFYGTYIAFPRLSFDFIIGGGYDFTELKRVSFDEISHSRPDATLLNILFGVEYQMIYDFFSITPILALEYNAYCIKEFREYNAPDYDIFLAKQDYESFRTLVGFKLNTNYDIQGVRFTPQVNIIWERENATRDRKFGIVKIGSRAPQTFFPVQGPAADIFVGGIDLTMKWGSFFSNAAYEFEGCDDYLLHFISLQLGLTF